MIMKKAGIVFVFLSALFFATGGLLIKLNGWNPVALNGARSICALPVMLVYMALTHHRFRMNRAVLFGALANSGMSVTFTIANKMTTAANAIVLQFTMPIFVILLLWIIWKQRPDRMAIATVALSLFGMGCFFLDSLSSGQMLGNLIAVLSGFLYAFVFVMKKIPGADFKSAIVVSYLINFAMGLPFLLQETDFGAANLWTTLALGVVQIGFAYICLDLGLDHVQPVAASLISMIEPILNPIMVAVFYGETMGVMAVIGAVIVLGSATAYNLAGISSSFTGLIPTIVKNGAVVNAFEVMRRLQRLIPRRNETIRIRNRAHNEEVLSRYKTEAGGRRGYIENQNAFSNLHYGKSTVKNSGCEVIAVFNALVALTGKKELSFPALIAEFEQDGMVMAARFGTAPKAVADFFVRHGYHTTFSTREEDFDRIADQNETMILTMYNDRKDIMQEIHSIAITREQGRLVAHNVYGNGRMVGPYASLSELIGHINGGRARGIALVAIKKKEDI